MAGEPAALDRLDTELVALERLDTELARATAVGDTLYDRRPILQKLLAVGRHFQAAVTPAHPLVGLGLEPRGAAGVRQAGAGHLLPAGGRPGPGAGRRH